MKYYKLIEPLSSKSTYGTLPNFETNMDFDENEDKDFINHKKLFIGNDKKIFVPELLQRKTKSSKVTNMLNAQSAGYYAAMIIDKKMKMVLEEYNLHETIFFESNFKMLNGEIFKYYFVKFKEGGYDFIDYSKTVFIKSYEEGKIVKINSKDDCEDIYYKKKISIRIKHLEFLEHISLDFFCVDGLSNEVCGFFISERLKERLEKEKLTGFQIIGINEDKWKLKAVKK